MGALTTRLVPFPAAFVALVAFGLSLVGCGKGTGEGASPAVAPSSPPYRERIDPAVEAEVGKRVLAARDEPLAVGDLAPDVEGMKPGTPTIVVFYRGHW